MLRFQNSLIVISVLTIGLITGCSSDAIKTEAKYPSGLDRTVTGEDVYGEKQSVFGKEGLKLLGSKDKKDPNDSGIAVNSFLWRAALDTVSFMPVASADPFGGVVLTDWYQPDPDVEERYKANVFILGRALRSDAVRVRTFKQKLKGGAWVDVSTNETTATQLEDTILTRARQLRVAQLNE